MEVTIRAEYTGKKDYFNYDENLLTKALEDKGFTDVYIQMGEWNGTKKKFFGLWTTLKEGRITSRANGIIMHLSEHVCTEDTILDLNEE